MKRYWAVALILALASLLAAVEKPYGPGTIVSVERKVNTKVLYYIVNTPVTRDDPYYEVSVQGKSTLYVADYTPRHESDTLPEDWKPGAGVELRVEKRHLFLKTGGGVDVDFVIVKQKHVEAGSSNPSAGDSPAPRK